MYAFMDALDVAFVLSNYVAVMLAKRVDILMSTDSRQLVDAVICGMWTQERRFGIHIAVARKSYRGY